MVRSLTSVIVFSLCQHSLKDSSDMVAKRCNAAPRQNLETDAK
ncbi:hypothetical protein [Pleionea sp. CnH1-48]|nr:hypothetical protein [Pleionea sp. CnH1-48]